jgi:hypothetical protein
VLGQQDSGAAALLQRRLQLLHAAAVGLSNLLQLVDATSKLQQAAARARLFVGVSGI